MENSAGFQNNEDLCQTPEEIDGACIYRETDAWDLHTADKS